MPTRDGSTADRTEQAIEAALQPGRFISHGAAWSFIKARLAEVSRWVTERNQRCRRRSLLGRKKTPG